MRIYAAFPEQCKVHLAQRLPLNLKRWHKKRYFFFRKYEQPGRLLSDGKLHNKKTKTNHFHLCCLQHLQRILKCTWNKVGKGNG